ncbi:MAG: UvrD-helicase domain-containing protein [Acidobacteria bacterium]|nr:UvrD-helicase domain-containing protein [Acidobacteriota bacterium]
MSEQLDLFGSAPGATHTRQLPDQPAREYAVDPRHNVVLEASAGTGKTTVLVRRYLNLLRDGVDPSNILAMTFTRKAAAEMRDRIVRELKRAASQSAADRARWNGLRDRLSDIEISTIDAFCLSLLREFPLEANLEPGFSMADETEVPRLVEEALDRALRICLLRASKDEELALVLAQLGITRARAGLAHLLQRRLVARQALDRFLASGPRDLHVRGVCRASVTRLQDALQGVPGGLAALVADGPVRHPRYRLFARDLARLESLCDAPPAQVRGVMERARRHFLKADGEPRTTAGQLHPYRQEQFDSPAAYRRHRDAVAAAAPRVKDALDAFSRDLNVVLARGVRQMFAIAIDEYRRTLEERSVLDFSDVLEHALALLAQMEEFSRSRYRLESRYHHVLVDEFQDTSRAQWELVSLLIQAWSEGSGVAHDAPLPPSIFVVGDRKQSIYRFRDAEVTVLQQAGAYIGALRPDGLSPRRSIAFSFRARPALLAFVNGVFGEIEQDAGRADAFQFGESDRFPPPMTADVDDARAATPLGIVFAETPEGCAAAVGDEIAALLGGATVRDRETGVSRPARPGDIAILFRSRASHREFEAALEERGIPAYVYKGLGFFDADEIKDLLALLRFLADPTSHVRAAALLRSRFVRISDEGLVRIKGVGSVLAALDSGKNTPDPLLRPDDAARLARARVSVAGWLRLADRVPPAELLDQILAETAYDYELRGPRRAQARENVKKMRALVRRIQNRGYATLRRIAEHLDSLSAGDESNATLEAVAAVNLMTVHAAKGLEFPVVFVVNLAKGAGGTPPPVRVVADGPGGEPSVSVASYISEADEDHRAREEEETKRLLYVALTRARDALYLGTVLKDGEMRPMRGSLGEVLPGSLRALCGSQNAAHDTVAWRTASGETHVLRVVKPAEPRRAAPVPLASLETAFPGGDIFGPLAIAGGAPRIAATSYASAAAAGTRFGAAQPFASADDLMVGTLVHRLFQSAVPPGDAAAVARRARALLRPEERAQLAAEEAAIAEASTLYGSLARRADVAAMLASGVCDHEVPFSLQIQKGDGSVILRGTIDCLVRRADGTVFILEFKTGRRKAEHARQLEIYEAAARALFPGADVSGAVIYP